MQHRLSAGPASSEQPAAAKTSGGFEVESPDSYQAQGDADSGTGLLVG